MEEKGVFLCVFMLVLALQDGLWWKLLESGAV